MIVKALKLLYRLIKYLKTKVTLQYISGVPS